MNDIQSSSSAGTVASPAGGETKQVRVTLSNGLAGCTIRDVIEVDAGATDPEIEAEVREWALERAEWSWEVVG